jgi:hypothetical protein
MPHLIKEFPTWKLQTSQFQRGVEGKVDARRRQKKKKHDYASKATPQTNETCANIMSQSHRFNRSSIVVASKGGRRLVSPLAT